MSYADELREGALRCIFHPDLAEMMLRIADGLDAEAEQLRPRSLGSMRRNPQRTERAAAARREPGWDTQCGLLLRAVVERGGDGYTQNEMETIPGIRTNAHRTRKNELVRDGLVMNSERTRLTDTGSEAIVWIATLKGHRWYEERRRRREAG
jgi:hypothetical protein